jgi:hypothetical protein
VECRHDEIDELDGIIVDGTQKNGEDLCIKDQEEVNARLVFPGSIFGSFILISAGRALGNSKVHRHQFRACHVTCTASGDVSLTRV